MANYLDPKNDLTFKRVFGEHKHLCMSLLNSMLPLEDPIVDIEYQTGELISDLIDTQRLTIVDVRCTDTEKRQFIVEMQMHWTESFKSRVLFNASKAYVKQLRKGKEIKLLQPVYALNFVNEIFEKSPEMANEYYHHYKIVNIKNTEKQIKGLEFVFIELPKFKPQNRAEKKLHELWLRFLTEINEGTEEAPKDLLDNELTREAIGYMEESAYTEGQLLTYDDWKIDAYTERAVYEELTTRGLKEGLEKGLEKGRAEGMEKGIKEGLKEGIREGLEKGRAEGKIEEKTEIALKLLKKGMSMEDVSDATELSKEQIEQLIKETTTQK